MSKIYIKKHNEEDAGNIFWVTMSDLMLGLAIIFITMFVFAMTGFTQDTIQQQKNKIEVTTKIEEELKGADIDVDIDKMTGSIKIPAAALFDLNSSILSDNGKKLLNNLAPIYINTIFSSENLLKSVDSISIQGYTDSQMFSGVKSEDEQFLRNMDLSLKRAQAVAQYILLTNYNKKYSKELRNKIVVEGNSYNKPIINNGKEDFNKSRRVEIKLVIKDWNVATALGLKQ